MLNNKVNLNSDEERKYTIKFTYSEEAEELAEEGLINLDEAVDFIHSKGIIDSNHPIRFERCQFVLNNLTLEEYEALDDILDDVENLIFYMAEPILEKRKKREPVFESYEDYCDFYSLYHLKEEILMINRGVKI